MPNNKEFIQEYIDTLSGKPKPADLLARFISDPVLIKHAVEFETAFPSYSIDVDQLVAEGDTVALRGTTHCTHKGLFAGIEATGKTVSAGLMIFYKIVDGKIANHWMQLDTMSLFAQLKG